MNLRDRTRERTLRTRVRRELRAAPALWKEYRRQRPRLLRQAVPSNWLGLVTVAAVAAALVAGLLDSSRRVEVPLALMAYWFVGGVAVATQRVFTSLYDAASVAALYHLPLTDDEIFRARWRPAWRSALVRASAYFGAGAALAIQLDVSLAGGLVLLVLPVLEALLAFVMALHVAAWVPRWSRWCLAGYVCAAAVYVGAQPARVWVEPLVASARWLPPFGWVNEAVNRVVLQGDWLALLLLIPVAGIVAAAPLSWQRVRAQYRLHEPEFESGEAEFAGPASELVAPGPTALSESIRSGAILRPDERIADAGWIEHAVHRWWTPRERVVAELFVSPRPGWSRQFRRMAWVFLPALAGLVLFAPVHPLVVVFSVTVPLLTGAPVLGGTWRGFEKRPAGGQFSPLYAIYPVGFGEALRTVLKANCLRLLSAVPFAVALAAAAAWRLTGSVQPGVGVALKGLALLFSLQPLVGTVRFADATNDTHRLRWGHLLWLIPLVPVLIGGGMAMFLGEGLDAVGLGWIAATGASLALTAGYARSWAKGRFDLLSERGDDSFGFPS